MTTASLRTRPRPIAPRWVTWALILLGALEVPWVIYLMFFQPAVVRAHHVRITTVGLGVAGLVLCAVAAVAILRRTRWSPVAAVATVTLLLFAATVSASSPGVRAPGLLPEGTGGLLLVAPAAVAGVVAARSVLDRAQHPTAATLAVERVCAGVLAVSVVPLAVRTTQHAGAITTTAVITQARALVVLLDTGEVVGLLGGGLASLGGRVRGTLVLATMAGVLLACDAWTNVMATTGEAFQAALVYLVVGEIPAMAVCALAVRAAVRRLPP